MDNGTLFVGEHEHAAHDDEHLDNDIEDEANRTTTTTKRNVVAASSIKRKGFVDVDGFARIEQQQDDGGDGRYSVVRERMKPGIWRILTREQLEGLVL